ncbi:unnamed protein product [Urochloa decumbens]|uniref:DUF4220 domain-containing protein n=1 Tax=Urochloa decumbens TaxID=240449 RepID=A0ABC9ASZ0_9POAL
MRPISEQHGSENVVKNQSLASAERLWNEWEVHFLILLSLALQVFLFITGSIRRRSASRIFQSLIWLAYLSADSVAVFVLGHLAVYASGPGHELMPFWAPFVLLHLGGQSTITAFSMQDNELWGRHLLGLVTQVTVAGYVVSKSSWPDGRLLAAMVLMFLSGCFKYAERTFCLYLASPTNLRDMSLGIISWLVKSGHRDFTNAILQIREPEDQEYFYLSLGSDYSRERARSELTERFRSMLNVHSTSMDEGFGDMMESILHSIVSMDAPLNDPITVLGANIIPSLHAQCKCTVGNGSKAYEIVAARLVPCQRRLYTKSPLNRLRLYIFSKYVDHCCGPCVGRCRGRGSLRSAAISGAMSVLLIAPVLYLPTFLTPIALALFRDTDKAGQLHNHSRADVIVSYTLLVGALALEVTSVLIMFSYCISDFTGGVVDLMSSASRKKWSEKLAQYNMIRTYATQSEGIPPQWIKSTLDACGFKLFDVTHISLPQDLKKLVLDKLLDFGAAGHEEWSFASTGGSLALHKWADKHKGSPYARPGTALHRTINGMEFQMRVLIWQIATDICYLGDGSQPSFNPDRSLKKMCRELSNYIMYLIFKCGVMLTTNSQFLHHRALKELERALSDHNVGEEGATREVFQAWKNSHGGPVTTTSSSSSQPKGHLQLLQTIHEDLESPVLPRACELAQELIAIQEDQRWDLITAVWLEMLFFTAPRCGGAFHSQHLTTGGEFITHVLLLMYFLGPFLPPRSEYVPGL